MEGIELRTVLMDLYVLDRDGLSSHEPGPSAMPRANLSLVACLPPSAVPGGGSDVAIESAKRKRGKTSQFLADASGYET